jgi:tellurite resistance protein TehA-like permease
MMAPFYGAPPIAMLTVGAGALIVGREVIGIHGAVILDSVLWTAGTLTGLAAAVIVPYLMFTAHELRVSPTLGSWLMPIVPPMVSAATGAALIPHLASGQPRLDMLIACYAMFGVSLVASLGIITLLWGRLTQHGPGPARTVPTLWIVLGPWASRSPPPTCSEPKPTRSCRPPTAPRCRPWASSTAFPCSASRSFGS